MCPIVPPPKCSALFAKMKGDKVFAVLNFSAKPHLVTFQEVLFHGRYTDYFSEEAIELGASAHVDLAPWGYRVFIQ